MSFSSWLRYWKRSLERSALKQTLRPKSTARRCVTPCLERLEDRLAPAILIVNTNADSYSASDYLTLREAIALADNGGNAQYALGRNLTTGEAGQISGTFGVNDTIRFDADLKGQTITLSSNLPYLYSNVSIIGLGASSLMISGRYQVFVVQDNLGVTASISGLTIENGVGYPEFNIGYLSGGGVYNGVNDTLTVSDCTISNNYCDQGGGIANNGTLTVSYCNISGNGSGLGGGGILNDGTATVEYCTLSGNNALSGYGGAISNRGTMTVIDSTLANNTAAAGGGILDAGTLTVNTSTIASNTATASNAAPGGGGIYVGHDALSSGGNFNAFNLTVSNSTIAYNNGTTEGGGILMEQNYAAPTLLMNTIVASNVSSTGPDDIIGTVSSGSYFNLIGDGAGMSGINNNFNLVGSSASPIDPLLDPPAYNGGPTQTLALQPNSPAINSGGVTNDLRAAINDTSSTTIQVIDAALIASTPGSYVISIDSEQMLVTNVDLANNTLTVVRGYNGTTAATHVQGSYVLTYDQRGEPRVYYFNGPIVDVGAFELQPLTSSVLQRSLESTGQFTIEANNNTDAQNLLSLVNGLSAPASPATVTINVAGGSYTDLSATLPTGVTLAINGNGTTTVIQGQSPALTLYSGNLILSGVLLTTSTNDPTVLVTGGSLTLRDCTVEQTANEHIPAVSITGGTADLGTANDPGNNIFEVEGPGTFINNSTNNAVPTVGDTFIVLGPQLTVNNKTVSGSNGAVVSNSGTFGDNNPGGASVTLSASIGTVTENADGTWSWSYTTPVGSPQFISVVITATDSKGNSIAAAFGLNVANAFTITTAVDNGDNSNPTPGSLRAAILASNQTPGTASNPDLIAFNIATSDTSYNATTQLFTIEPLSALPAISDPAILDGYTQSGASPNTLAQGDSSNWKIVLDGSLIGSGNDGLAIAAGGSTVEGLYIQNFSNDIHLTTNGNDLIAGNYLANGVFVDNVPSNTLGGTTPEARNVMGRVAIEGAGASGNQVQGNYIGTDGTHLFPHSGSGSNIVVYIADATHNLIGGPLAGEGNVIDSTDRSIEIAGDPGNGNDDNVVQGNYIGVDASGNTALSGSYPAMGIFVEDSCGNVIGGPSSVDPVTGKLTGAGNVVGGLLLDIVLEENVTGLPPGNNVVQGNFVGTNATGTAVPVGAASNSWGITCDGYSNGNIIGGTNPGEGNLISGNGTVNLEVDTSGNQVLGNLIGTDVTGTHPLASGTNGIGINAGSGNVLGGTAPGAGNVIAFNSGAGVEIEGSGNSVQGNSISQNTGEGIAVYGPNNLVGGTLLIDSNVISGNSGDGVFVGNGANSDSILRNAISANGSLGVHLDRATNANDNQAAPVLTSASSSSGGATISGTLTSTANTTFRIEFFSNAGLDASGNAEGQTYLGFTMVTTDGNGNASFTATNLAPLPAGQIYLTSTATVATPNGDGTYTYGDSSEFSNYLNGPILTAANVTVSGSNGVLVSNSGTFSDATPGATVTLTASLGTIVQNSDGTWSWSYATPAGAPQSSAVTITATDNLGNSATIVFGIDVGHVFMVTTGLDNGNDSSPTPGSLRAAILASHQTPGTASNPELIAFNIPTTDPSYDSNTGSFDVLTPAPGLTTIPNVPDLTVPVIIDGYTQPGAQVNTLAQGDNAVLKIVLNGSPVVPDGTQQDLWDPTSPVALNLRGGSTTVRGLVINNFVYNGGNGTTAIDISSDNNIIEGNYIGTDVTGENAQGNAGSGVQVFGPNSISPSPSGATGSHNRIGMLGDGVKDFADRNIISANGVNATVAEGEIGIRLDSASYNVVAGNYIGTDASGTKPLGNGVWGVFVENAFGTTAGGSGYNQIGGNGPSDVADGNIISANEYDGIAIVYGESNNTIYGNEIGTDVTGTVNLGNGHNGVLIATDTQGIAIGGNVIAYNGEYGVAVSQDQAGSFFGVPLHPGPTNGIEVEANSIHDNGIMGIDVGGTWDIGSSDPGLFSLETPLPGVLLNDSQGHAGPNHFQDFPVLTDYTSNSSGSTVTGTLSNTTASVSYHLEFFANAAPEPTGYGEGQSFLGSYEITSASGGAISFTATGLASVPSGEVYLSATATNLATGDTSEFSQDLQPAGQPPVAVAALNSSLNGGRTEFTEGDTVYFDGTGSHNVSGTPMTHLWDFGDGTTSTDPMPGHQFQDGNPGGYTVTLTVFNLGRSNTTTTTVIVNDVAPTAEVSGPSLGVPGQPRTFTFSATSPSPIDQAAGFSYAINWGDGKTQTIAAAAGNGAGAAVDHIYTAPGSYNVKVTATDDDGSSPVASQIIAIQPVKMEGNSLAVGGTTGNDTITLTPADTTGDINVTLNRTSLGNFKPTDHILVYTQTGNDTVTLASTKIKGAAYYITVGAFLYGGGTGKNNDVLDARGSTANNVLVGGAGNNTLYGGLGRDLLIAGLGASTIYSGSADDIMIGGWTDYADLTSSVTTYAQQLAALEAIMAEWGSSDSYATRVSDLTSGGGLNGAYLLNTSTVHENGKADTLYGTTNSSLDWFFAGATDILKNKKSGEVLTPI